MSDSLVDMFADANRMHDDDDDESSDLIETYHLEQDNDGHWYVIPDGTEDDFRRWVEQTSADKDSEFDFEDCRLSGSPSLVHFPRYWVEGGEK